MAWVADKADSTACAEAAVHSLDPDEAMISALCTVWPGEGEGEGEGEVGRGDGEGQGGGRGRGRSGHTLLAAYMCKSSLLVMSCTVECQMSLVENSPARSISVIMTSVYHSKSGKNLQTSSLQSCLSSLHQPVSRAAETAGSPIGRSNRCDQMVKPGRKASMET